MGNTGMDDNPLMFNPYRGDPRILHGPEDVFSNLIWGTNLAMAILHMPSLLGFQSRKFNKDLIKGIIEEATVTKSFQQGSPKWLFFKPNLAGLSVPSIWWKEAHSYSWKVERQGSASES